MVGYTKLFKISDTQLVIENKNKIPCEKGHFLKKIITYRFYDECESYKMFWNSFFSFVWGGVIFWFSGNFFFCLVLLFHISHEYTYIYIYIYIRKVAEKFLVQNAKFYFPKLFDIYF